MTKSRAGKIVLLAACLLVGFVLGVVARAIPYVKLKYEIDLSTIIAFLSLVGAIYIIPFLVNTYFSKRDNTNQVIISDMNLCLEKLEVVAALYKSLYLASKKITRNNMKELLSDLRRATNCLAALAVELDKYPHLKKFRSEVFEQYNEETYKDHTENTHEGAQIDDQNYLVASKSIERTMSGIKRYRYLTYSG